MSENLLEQAVVFNELYIKNVSSVDGEQVDVITKKAVEKKKPKLSKKYTLVKSYGQLSKEQKIAIERMIPESYTQTSDNFSVNYKRQWKTVDGVLLALYFDNRKNLGFIYMVALNKKDKVVAKRIYWRLQKKQKPVKKEDTDIFDENFMSLEEDLESSDEMEITIDEQMEIIESCVLLAD